MRVSTGWPPRLPMHWERVPLKYLVEISGGSTPSKESLEYWDGDIPWVTPRDMKRFRINGTALSVTQKALEETGLSLIVRPGVLMVVRGMILARLIPIAINTVPVTVNQDMKHLRPICGSVRYLAYSLIAASDALSPCIEVAGHGTRAMRSDLAFLEPMPVPPLDEQRAIADFLDRETGRIDSLQAMMGSAAGHRTSLSSLLAEKRMALIAAAVTGQIDITASANAGATDRALDEIEAKVIA